MNNLKHLVLGMGLGLMVILTIAPGWGWFGSSSSTANVTLTGSTVIRTNLLVDSTGSATISPTNFFEAVWTNGMKSIVLNRNDGNVYVGSNIISRGQIVGFDGGTYSMQLSDVQGNNGVLSFARKDNATAYGAVGSFILGGFAVKNTGGFYFASAGAAGDVLVNGGSYVGGSIENPINGTILLSTNLIARGTITATNGVLVSTNYAAANMTPVPGFISLVGSNNVLYIVTTTTTNRIP